MSVELFNCLSKLVFQNLELEIESESSTTSWVQLMLTQQETSRSSTKFDQEPRDDQRWKQSGTAWWRIPSPETHDILVGLFSDVASRP